MKLFCPDDHEVMLPCTHLSSALRAALYSGSVKASQRSSASSAVNNRSPRADVAEFVSCIKLYKEVNDCSFKLCHSEGKRLLGYVDNLIT